MFKFNENFLSPRLVWQKGPEKGKSAPAKKPEAQKKDVRTAEEGLKAAEDLVKALDIPKSDDTFNKAVSDADKKINKSKLKFNDNQPVLQTSSQSTDKKGKGVNVKVETPTSTRQAKLKEKSPTYFKKAEGVTETGQAKTKLDVGGKIAVAKDKLPKEFIEFLNGQAKNEYPNDFLANYGDDKYIIQNNEGNYRVFSA
ncbi:MAG: hypothetical protein ACRCZE_04760 [Candidatus Altimarinota bacterium]